MTPAERARKALRGQGFIADSPLWEQVTAAIEAAIAEERAKWERRITDAERALTIEQSNRAFDARQSRADKDAAVLVEREACAKLCEQKADLKGAGMALLDSMAAAIRARGEVGR